MAKKLTLDKETCTMCQACGAASDDYIQFDDDGYPKECTVEDADAGKAQAGVEACPTEAIKLVDE